MSRSTWIAAPSAYAVFLIFLDDKAIRNDHEKKTRLWKAAAVGISGLLGAFIYMKRDVFASLLHIGGKQLFFGTKEDYMNSKIGQAFLSVMGGEDDE